MNQFPLTYKGHALMRKDNIIYYGSMSDKYIVMIQILSSTPMEDLKLSGKVLVQLQFTDPEISAKDRIVKSAERVGLWNAVDLASVWLERALAPK
ncbi:MAG: hypothetical protein IKY46_05445 [Clostridia bacterium]|nr:hypothetical protein [Clostridia bacterium]MBR4955342.1 hypothetical protein [Clostridia bacterium]MBR5903809.1 hypothetical protein [Clostridia bacterium]